MILLGLKDRVVDLVAELAVQLKACLRVITVLRSRVLKKKKTIMSRPYEPRLGTCANCL
jgi:hypothetical protein